MSSTPIMSGRRLLGLLAIAASATPLAACGSGGSSAAATPPSSTAAASHAASAPATAPSPDQPLAGKVIVLDPGHNGGNAAHPEIINKKVDIVNARKACNTTGTSTDDGYAEHAFTWDVANRLAKILRKDGAKVVLTRKNDKGVGPCIDERARIGNRAHADAVLSIHGDGAPASGHGFHIIEPAVIHGHGDQAMIKAHNAEMVPVSRKLGMDLRNAFHQGAGVPYSSYLGKKGIDVRGDLGGLNVSQVPAVFIECGNMRNAGDAAKMKSAQGRQQMATALAAGFVKFLG